MPKTLIVRRNEYHDSIQLMRVSEEIRKFEGVRQAMVSMATETNVKIINDLGLMNDAGRAATVDDMLIAIDADSVDIFDKAIALMEEQFRKKAEASKNRVTHHTFESALKAMSDANVCAVTVPGEYCYSVTKKALEAGLHCVVYSDNVPLEEDRALKELAASRGLLCMGPDCGVCNINGAAFMTASAVGSGPIGVAGASGSGTQQITALAEKFGSGISQAIGLGGKDLKDEVGGLSMLAAIDALEEDPQTTVIILVSRTPGEKTQPAILNRVKKCKKPVVVYFIGGDPALAAAAGATPATDSEDATLKAVAITRGLVHTTSPFTIPQAEVEAIVKSETAKMSPQQKFLRGLFCGGTFCEEAMAQIEPTLGGIYSNAPLSPELKLKNSLESVKHTIIDLGDEEFTLGRPHPVIDPEPVRQAIVREAAYNDVSVILMDFILGPAINPDPVGSVIDFIIRAKKERSARGGYLSIITSVCGGSKDPQDIQRQETMLREAGAIIMPSNAQAARMAGLIAKSAMLR